MLKNVDKDEDMKEYTRCIKIKILRCCVKFNSYREAYLNFKFSFFCTRKQKVSFLAKSSKYEIFKINGPVKRKEFLIEIQYTQCACINRLFSLVSA